MAEARLALVVDDEPHLRTYIAAVFRKAGWRTATARDGAEGLDKAREMSPDLISLDLMMPGGGGVSMYQALKADARLAAIPVLVVSAIGRQAFDHARRTVAAATGQELPPPAGYVEKPPSPGDLLAAAGTALGG